MHTHEKYAISIDEFATRFSIGKTKIYYEIKQGRLKAYKTGHRTLIRIEDAYDWFANLSPLMDSKSV